MKEEIYYSSHSGLQTFRDFIISEVVDKGNYTEDQIVEWAKKYNLTKSSLVIWVSPIKWIANRYNLFASEWDDANKIPEDQMNIYEYSSKKGFIIPESDDGEHGFLFVYIPEEGEIVQI